MMDMIKFEPPLIGLINTLSAPNNAYGELVAIVHQEHVETSSGYNDSNGRWIPGMPVSVGTPVFVMRLSEPEFKRKLEVEIGKLTEKLAASGKDLTCTKAELSEFEKRVKYAEATLLERTAYYLNRDKELQNKLEKFNLMEKHLGVLQSYLGTAKFNEILACADKK